jgi:hypothetical protein
MVAEVSLAVAPLLALTDDEVRAAYVAYMESCKRVADESGERVVEVVDMGGCAITVGLLRKLPLLIELVRIGQREYEHTLRTVVLNAPYGVTPVWTSLLAAVPTLRAHSVEFR